MVSSVRAFYRWIRPFFSGRRLGANEIARTLPCCHVALSELPSSGLALHQNATLYVSTQDVRMHPSRFT
jgi:hypothetical protein